MFKSDSDIFKVLNDSASSCRIVLLAGLSAVGKSLYVQQLGLLAKAHGRTVHLLQWDVTRAAFEADDYLEKYPEVDGVTHPMIRKAVGVWARAGVHDWASRFPGDDHILIGEVPLVDNRLIELVQNHDDHVEALLASSATRLLIPVPSTQVREHIVGARAKSIAEPSNAREAADAPPNVVDANWWRIHEVAGLVGMHSSTGSKPDYDPEIYAGVYEYLCQHRHHVRLRIDEVLSIGGSVYDAVDVASELAATPNEVAQIYADLETGLTAQALEDSVNDWYRSGFQ